MGKNHSDDAMVIQNHVTLSQVDPVWAGYPVLDAREHFQEQGGELILG